MQGIYAIRNLETADCYVGSAVDIERRWRHHRSRLRSGKHHAKYMQRSFNKYGESTFAYVILEECNVSDESIRIARENYWMSKLGAAYNSAPVAGSTLGLRFVLSEETKKKIGASIKGTKQTPEWVAKRTANASMHLRNRVIKDETRAKLSASLKGIVKTKEWQDAIIKSLTGKRRTAEQKERIAAGVRAAYARKAQGNPGA